MTLVKTKHHRITTEHRQRTGQHHRHGHDYLKTYWPYLPIVAIVIAGFAANNWVSELHRSVLGYATDMSAQTLLDDTNTARTDDGLTSLSINEQLDEAAQAKANNMAALNYWSHDTPSGQTPWSFISAAGYDYQTAGENLAYGFGTSAEVLTAWMNSPEHRANILNTTYQNVGFGVVNIPNYQSTGPETLVVAMYASPASAAVAAASPQPTTMDTTPAVASTLTDNDTAGIVPQQAVSRLQLVLPSDAATGILLIVMFGAAASAFVIIKHGLAWRKVLVRGEAFILHHPLLDIVAVSLVTACTILTRSAGFIR